MTRNEIPNSGAATATDDGASNALPMRMESTMSYQSPLRINQSALLKELKLACDSNFLNNCNDKYMRMAECMHFVFCKNYPVGTYKHRTKEQGGTLSQVCSPQLDFLSLIQTPKDVFGQCINVFLSA